MSRVGCLPRVNPFSTRFIQPGAIPFHFPTPDGLAAIVRRLEGAGGRGQIIGPHGSGKSTLLAALLGQRPNPPTPFPGREGGVSSLPRRGRGSGVGSFPQWRPRLVRLNTTNRTLPEWVWEGEAPAGPPTTESGSAGASPCLVIDGFEQLGLLTRWRLVRRCSRTGTGLLVTAHRPVGLPTLYRTDISAETASAVIAGLIPPGGEWVLDGFDIAERLRSHSGSLREVLFELYDRWQAGPG